MSAFLESALTVEEGIDPTIDLGGELAAPINDLCGPHYRFTPFLSSSNPPA